jgi:molecular chaperone Hsp33
MKNYIQRFIFDKLPLRGAFVLLEDVWLTIANQRKYPEGLRRSIGELLLANILLSANLKLDGKIVAQIQDNSKLDLIVSECSNNFTVRATAKIAKSTVHDNEITYDDVISDGVLVISIDSENNGKIYQSVISLQANSDLAFILNEYMSQSEQLKAFFVFMYTEDKIVGFMVQQLPDPTNVYDEQLERLFMLASTLHKSELMTNSLTTLLHKLFNEDDIMVFDAESIQFACTCSREKVTNVIRSLGKDEAMGIVAEEGIIRVNCDFCNTKYIYDAPDVMLIFESLCADIDGVSRSIH